ncbi:hypothetical protein F5J12DRAFT_794997 [Pisolithus orientalis]|uniref:uncharacterized protein n=1 Tax=Pisolithus orientalis TaxID=936130 RepID=UPI002225498E|nr:uncharacterized protein F5J12DRAFT_794997 [Pisolithus orientalis]KAI6035655.1 hypothetical protein F5J12DRAFT_794997 [Pisolithus orientalis]
MVLDHRSGISIICLLIIRTRASVDFQDLQKMSNAALTTRDVRSMALLDGFTRSNQGQCSVCLEGQVPERITSRSHCPPVREETQF